MTYLIINNKNMDTQSEKSRTATFVLCLFLGGLGVHRLYAGKIGTGILQLVLTLTFFGIVISGPWAFIDFILIAAGQFKDKDGFKINRW